MKRVRVEKGALRRRADYGFASALTHQPKLARILRDWEERNLIRFLTEFLNAYQT